MSPTATRWRHAVDTRPAVRFLDRVLRGISQVVFCDNPIAGAVIGLAVLAGALHQDTPLVAVGAGVGVVTGTVTARLLRLDPDQRRRGMYGFSPLLTGSVVPTLTPPSIGMWVLMFAGAAVTTVITAAATRVLDRWGIPASTFPFVFTSWLIVVLTGPRSVPLDGPVAPGELLTAPLTGMSEVFLVGGWFTGAVVFVVLAVQHPPVAAWAVVGAVGSTGAALILGVPAQQVAQGQYGFSSVLITMALGAVFVEPSWRSARYALTGLVCTVLVQFGLSAVLPAGIPIFTAPFISTLWVLLAIRRRVDRSRSREPIRVGAVG